MSSRRSSSKRAGPSAWLAAIAIVAGLFWLGDRQPQLRGRLEAALQDLLRPEDADGRLSGVPRVVDGDTLHIGDQRIRLFGIDAPEGGQTCRIGRRDWACGEDATAELRQRVGQRAVTCEQMDIDRYSRVVAECWAGGENLNAWMVRNGWALAYRQYGGSRYDADELVAQAARRGVWASKFIAPWDWRRERR